MFPLQVISHSLSPLGTVKMSVEHLIRNGQGRVPRTPLLSAAWKELWEIPAVTAGCVVGSLGTKLQFSEAGLSFEQFRAFFDESLDVAKKVEPISESGNKYSVCKDFQKLNGELLLHDIQHSASYQGLSEVDKERADEFFSFMCLNKDLRNRNPLHPNPLDSVVIGNLLNFPKHIFGFPFAGYSTNGNEALSLALFSYRARCKRATARVLYILADGEECEKPLSDIRGCCNRLGMLLEVATPGGLATELGALAAAAVVLTSLTNPALEEIAERAESAGVGLHIHVLDEQFRSILSNPEPVHVDMPAAVSSMSLQDGLFRSGYQLYRDPVLRDLHFDLPYEWQSQYVSPNEGGSGNSTPLYIDFVFIQLGWKALGDAARRAAPRPADLLQAVVLPPCDLGTSPLTPSQKVDTLEGLMTWAKDNANLPTEELQRNVFQFQRNFVGGKGREVEAITSGGGTRSINLAIESVLARARASLPNGSPIKLITGNPHLAVERAERRFLFEVVRVQNDGIICLDGLKNHISDPFIVAVYTQTLSITDGITDPLEEVVQVLEEENERRHAIGAVPVTLINDCCLALSVLLHNDGQNGARNMRVLDLTLEGHTPTIVTLDAHKHLGADKGISMAMGSAGTLSHLNGHVKVGSQPSNGELIRAMADMLHIGVDGYYAKYKELYAAVDSATSRMETAGLTLIHAHNRVKGSTAFGVEDPNARMGRIMKKKGHSPAPLFNISPSNPTRCQTGFLMSLTPHVLREVRGVPALDIFVEDVIEAKKTVDASPSLLAKLFKEASLPAILLSGGNEDTWLFSMLYRPGFFRDIMSVIFRRIYSAIMDSGYACSNRHVAPLQTVVLRAMAPALLLLLISVRRLVRNMRQRLRLTS